MSLFGSKGVTRRRFAFGAVGGTAAAVTSMALAACDDGKAKKTSGTPQVVRDDSKVVDVLADYKSDDSQAPAVAQSWTLPLGTVLFHCEGTHAAAMLAPASALAPNTLGALSLSTGDLTTLVPTPKSGNAWTFFDVRCASGVFAWIEIDYTKMNWVLYGQGFSNGALSGEAVKLDSGGKDFEPPRITCTGSSVIWLRMPLATGSKASTSSYCYRWNVGDAKGSQVWQSTGRFATAPRVSKGILTISPRVNNDQGTFYGMTALDISNGKNTQVDQLVLPETVSPFDAVYTGEAFVFSIESAYSSAGALGKMGTFIGREGGPYVYFSREPAAQVAFNGSRFLIKTQSAHYAVDTQNKVYAGITSPDRSLDFGDYPASEGETSRFLTFATVRNAQGVPETVTARVFSV